MLVSVESLTIKAKVLDFRVKAMGKSKYQVLKEGIMGGGYQGTISECEAFLDGWAARAVSSS